MSNIFSNMSEEANTRVQLIDVSRYPDIPGPLVLSISLGVSLYTAHPMDLFISENCEANRHVF